MSDWLYTYREKSEPNIYWHSNKFKQSNEYFNKPLIGTEGEQYENTTK